MATRFRGQSVRVGHGPCTRSPQGRAPPPGSPCRCSRSASRGTAPAPGAGGGGRPPGTRIPHPDGGATARGHGCKMFLVGRYGDPWRNPFISSREYSVFSNFKKTIRTCDTQRAVIYLSTGLGLLCGWHRLAGRRPEDGGRRDFDDEAAGSSPPGRGRQRRGGGSVGAGGGGPGKPQGRRQRCAGRPPPLSPPTCLKRGVRFRGLKKNATVES